MTTDASGNVYVTGLFTGQFGPADFDPGPGTFGLNAAGSTDIFVAKYTSDGALVWAKALGGSGGDSGYGIAVDSSGNVYTTGYFQGTADFDPDTGVFNLTEATGGIGIFVSKLDSSGNFVWAKQFGGASTDWGYGIAVDSSGNVYTTGYFQGTADFDPGAGTLNLTSGGGFSDVFVSKLDSSGNLVWVRQLGGTGSEKGNAVTVDSSGNVYTTGTFTGTVDFDPGAGTFNMTSVGVSDVFVSKLDSSGNFVWTKQFGGPNGGEGNGIAVDSSGNVYTGGTFSGGPGDFDPGPGVFNLSSSGDSFVSKLDSLGNFVWARQLGGDGAFSTVEVNGLVLDS